MNITIEEVKSELKACGGDSVLAIAAPGGGWIPVESIRFQHKVIPEKPGMGSGTNMLILSDSPQLGEPRIWTVKRLGSMLKSARLPEDTHLVFTNSDGTVIPIVGIKCGQPDKSETAGTLAVLAKNPWN